MITLTINRHAFANLAITPAGGACRIEAGNEFVLQFISDDDALQLARRILNCYGFTCERKPAAVPAVDPPRAVPATAAELVEYRFGQALREVKKQFDTAYAEVLRAAKAEIDNAAKPPEHGRDEQGYSGQT